MNIQCTLQADSAQDRDPGICRHWSAWTAEFDAHFQKSYMPHLPPRHVKLAQPKEMSHFCDACDVLFNGPENYAIPGTVNAGERKNFNAASGCRKYKRKSAFLADSFTILEIYILKIYSAHNSVKNYY